MKQYRILEKKGTIKNPCKHTASECNGLSRCCKEEYIPRFIIQETGGKPEREPALWLGFAYQWFDIKEFTSIEEAREYKRNLELEEGIVIE